MYKFFKCVIIVHFKYFYIFIVALCAILNNYHFSIINVCLVVRFFVPIIVSLIDCSSAILCLGKGKLLFYKLAFLFYNIHAMHLLSRKMLIEKIYFMD